MIRNTTATLVSIACLFWVAPDAFAQRAGQSVTVRTGTVTAMRSVDLNDGNAIKGALVGGELQEVLRDVHDAGVLVHDAVAVVVDAVVAQLSCVGPNARVVVVAVRAAAGCIRVAIAVRVRADRAVVIVSVVGSVTVAVETVVAVLDAR